MSGGSASACLSPPRPAPLPSVISDSSTFPSPSPSLRFTCASRPDPHDVPQVAAMSHTVYPLPSTEELRLRSPASSLHIFCTAALVLRQTRLMTSQASVLAHRATERLRQQYDTSFESKWPLMTAPLRFLH
jgi:hypothetical protein